MSCSRRIVVPARASLPLPVAPDAERSAATILQTYYSYVAETVRSAVIQYGQEEYYAYSTACTRRNVGRDCRADTRLCWPETARPRVSCRRKQPRSARYPAN